MKILLAAPGYPPECNHPLSRGARSLARGLAARGHELLVLAGSRVNADAPRVVPARDRSAPEAEPFEVRRLWREDPRPEHWQRGHSVSVSRAFQRTLEEWRPDLLHVVHWRRLSSDLVWLAARAGVPAVAYLGDEHATCLLERRVQPGEDRPCVRSFQAMTCVRCAGTQPPYTPWIPFEQQLMAFAARADGLHRERRLARRLFVPDFQRAEHEVRYAKHTHHTLVIPLPGPRAKRRLPAAPDPGTGVLRLASWAHVGQDDGLELLLDARGRAALALEGKPELEFAIGGSELPELPSGCSAVPDGGKGPWAVPTRVHAAVLVHEREADHARWSQELLALGLPGLVPAGARLTQPFPVAGGLLTYREGDAADLARVILRLARDPGLVAELRADLPQEPDPSAEQILDRLEETYASVLREGTPEEMPEPSWFEDRMRAADAAAWDAAYRAATPEQLGLDPTE